MSGRAARERRDPLAHEQRRARRPAGAEAVLRRSAEDRRFGGVAGGIASFVGADPRRIRTLFVLAVPLSIGIAAGGYLLLWALLPRPDRPAGPPRDEG